MIIFLMTWSCHIKNDHYGSEFINDVGVYLYKFGVVDPLVKIS